MRISVALPGELGETELAAWRSIQRDDPALANPFLSPEFTLAVGACRADARVAVLFDGARPVGFFPHQRRPFGVGVPIGAGLSDCQGAVVEPGVHVDAGTLLRACRLSVWEFDHLAAGQKLFEGAVTATAPSPAIDVTAGYPALLERLRASSPKFLRTTLAKERKLAARCGELSFEYASGDRSTFHTLISWKSAQYRRTGRSDRFAHPWIVELLERLHAVSGPDFAGRLSVLRAGGRVAAAHFGLASRHVLACWFPTYDTELARFSPGLVLHLRMAEAAAAEGLWHLDMGRGEMAYKESLKTHDLTVAEGSLTRPTPVTAAHWLLRSPPRRLRAAVLADPRLRRAADRTLKGIGRLRTATRSAGH
ncbi:GNAT family N-acetyltransferase [Allostreptomyces psammosilenae]|uniref:CelD/BcsL family acetyltransferase involved in cellulose biosynthesis n=1 Tax=Allostreptomyces psammosilenae TaxID=1892865 RepID=A0A853A137_9ACTN|nr:GNAT family N-acetyltransferase [Allostreptomyces psammosilenae]NYI08115.1 CelD/BcsL family acetyltransferase involved in cellulose biosynthesis [Allostreptomyces psammosilenae]